MNFKRLYLNLSIKYKLLIYFYIIILIISLAFGFYSYTISANQVRERVSAANSDIVKQISNNITFLQKDTVDVSTYISISSGIQEVLAQDDKDSVPLPEKQIQNLSSFDFILNAIVSKDYISGMILYSNSGRPVYNEFTDGSNGINHLSALIKSGIYNKINEYDGKPYWFSIDKNDSLIFQNNANPKIAMGRVIKNLYNAEKVGYIILFINKKTIEDIYINNIHSPNESFFIINENHKLISNNGTKISDMDVKAIDSIVEKNLLNTDYFPYRIHNENILITYSPIVSADWRIFYSVPMKNLVDKITSIKFFTILIIISAIIFTFPLILLISTYFTAPIKKLLTSMKRFERGNFDERVSFKYNDEIGILGTGYNKMVESINKLINTTYKLEIREKEAELSALQAQINPHFLYNTLNTIYYKAQKTKQYEIGDMIFQLSQFSRLALNSGRNWTTIDKEKELIYCYLSLQTMRFKDRIKFNLEIEDNLLNYYMPKLILQPFVENAVIHGISDRTEGGSITITGKLIDNNILFTIEDTGLGMSDELVNILNSANINTKEYSSTKGGYAVKNVTERLKLTFKDDYSILFKSVLGKGTSVELLIPLVEYQPLKGD